MKRTFYLFLGLLTISLALILGLFSHVKEKDYILYNALLESSSDSLPFEVDTDQHALQTRTGIRKDFRFVSRSLDKNKRINLTSASSEVHFQKNGQQMHMREIMKDVFCFIQEEIYFVDEENHRFLMQPNGEFLLKGKEINNSNNWFSPQSIKGILPRQKVRIIKSEQALYDYKKNQLTMKNAMIHQYDLEGHGIVHSFPKKNILMSGKAQGVVLSLKKGNPELYMRHFTATFFSEDSL